MVTNTKNTLSLKALLAHRLVSQKELAEKLNATEADVSRYVHGRRKPRLQRIRQLSVLLNATPVQTRGGFRWIPRRKGGVA